MRLLILAAAVTGASAATCQDTTAQNFLLRSADVADNALCAFAPAYYCENPIATNYQSGASAARLLRPLACPECAC